MGQLILSNNIRNRLDDLVEILYYDNYFKFKESAQKYVDKIYDFIETIPNQTIIYECKTPIYGKYYARYKNPKSGFMYYITYDTMDGIYFIENIISPKTKEYLAIKGTKK